MCKPAKMCNESDNVIFLFFSVFYCHCSWLIQFLLVFHHNCYTFHNIVNDQAIQPTGCNLINLSNKLIYPSDCDFRLGDSSFVQTSLSNILMMMLVNEIGLSWLYSDNGDSFGMVETFASFHNVGATWCPKELLKILIITGARWWA